MTLSSLLPSDSRSLAPARLGSSLETILSVDRVVSEVLLGRAAEYLLDIFAILESYLDRQ